jgi:hypothetical protein
MDGMANRKNTLASCTWSALPLTNTLYISARSFVVIFFMAQTDLWCVFL